MSGGSELLQDFKASTGWLRNAFMHPKCLSLRRKTSIAQKDPDQLIDKLVAFVLHTSRVAMKPQYKPCEIIAMDKTPV